MRWFFGTWAVLPQAVAMTGNAMSAASLRAIARTLPFAHGGEADRREPARAARLPPGGARRGGPRPHRNGGEVPARGRREPAPSVRRSPKRRALARRLAHLPVRARRDGAARPGSRPQAPLAPPRDRLPRRAGQREGPDARPDAALLQGRAREGRARGRTGQGAPRPPARDREARRRPPDRTRPQSEAAMSELPGGTVTFLFTDIEGSTRLLQELGDDYALVLAEHHRLFRALIDEHGGHEVDTQGDAFFVVF